MNAETVLSSYTPVEAPIPPPPDTSFYSSTQWKTLFSLADAIIPSIRLNEYSSNDKAISTTDWDYAVSKLTSLMPGHDAETAAQYLKENVSSNPGFRAYMERIFGSYVPADGKKAIGEILNDLNSADQSLILTGSTTPIHEQSLEFREKAIASWDTSQNATLRAVYRALTGVVKKAWVINSQTINKVLGFPQIPNVTPTDGFPFKFLQISPGNHPETIETDVVVVGSGCGGGVAAKNLAEAGLRVLVVEKGYSYSREHFPMAPDASLNLYEEGCALQTDDGTLLCMAGSCFGGGGTVNWSASLQTQEFVRQEWADTGLPFFTSAEFQTSLDRVCDRMGVNTGKIRHSCGNNVILDGARKLGYSVKPVPQNTGNSDHYCGHCAYGCAAGGKKGPIESFLVDSAKAGTVFMEGYHAEKVLFEDRGEKKIAIGVEGIWKSRDSYLGLADNASPQRKVIIKARRVIVSCGALQSPLLLLRSGLTNSHIGKHLRLHPCLLGNAVFDKRTNPWEGSALTTVVNDFEKLDGKAHGTKIEALSMMPSMFIPAFPWRDGLDYKLWAAGMSHGTSFITLTRDRDGGRVYADPVDGRCRIEYTVSPFDCQHMVEGIIGCAKIAYVTGAREFHTSYRDIAPWIRPDVANTDAAEGPNNASLEEWIADLRQKLPLNPERALFASAHQMSTCRMGADSTTSVVDSSCQVWDTEGLFVVDASVFPSASGVNPMVTNMAIADWATRNIARRMDRTEAVTERLSHL